MDSSQQALMALGLSAGLAVALVLVFWVVYIIAFWKVFTKAGQPGWKAIIPFYNDYILYKISWKASMFWVFVLAACIGSALVSASGGDINAGVAGTGPAYIIGIILYLVSFVVYIMQNYKTSKAYGHGVGFCLGLIFFNFIFMLIIGFGGSQYKGPQK